MLLKRIALVLAIFFTGFLSNRFFRDKADEGQITNKAYDSSRVVRVIDGDTIELEDGKRVRYIGINTPELPNECFSREATEENKRLVLDKTVQLVGDTTDTDAYGRLLRYVYNGTDFINDDLARGGFAKIEPIAPDTKFSKQFFSAQQEAKEASRGLWSNCVVH